MNRTMSLALIALAGLLTSACDPSETPETPEAAEARRLVLAGLESPEGVRFRDIHQGRGTPRTLCGLVKTGGADFRRFFVQPDISPRAQLDPGPPAPGDMNGHMVWNSFHATYGAYCDRSVGTGPPGM